MPNAFLNKKWLNFSKTQFLTQNGVKPSKTLVSNKILKNPVYNKRGLSETTVMSNALLNKKGLNFSKTHFLTKNGVRRSKTLVWTTNVEKIQVRTKEVFLKVQCMPNAFLNKKWLNFSKTRFLTQNIIKPCKTYFLSQKDVKPSKTLVSTQNIEKSSFKQKNVFFNLQLMPNAFLNKK